MKTVDLLLITWNRRAYVEKTLANLFASDDDFNLYCWDNNSEDGTADIIAAIDDPRVVKKYFSKTNVKQREPTLWFFDQANSDLVGKIDDDILLPHGWINKIAPIVRNNPSIGMMGCWIFMQDDWDESLARHKFVTVGDYVIFPNMWIAGQSFLGRLDYLKQYIKPENEGYGFPVDQYKMTIDGLINGYPFPIIFAHNMDDPRSEFYVKDMGEHAALTSRVLGFKTNEEYGGWIAQDAQNILNNSVKRQVKSTRIRNDKSIFGKIRSRIYRYIKI